MALLYALLGALVVGAVAFGVAVLITGADPGLATAEPDGSAVPLPTNRPLTEHDFAGLRFDTGLRGYRMGEVDTALRRAAYDVGYKEELIAVLEAEVSALRAGRLEEADALQRARMAALGAEKSPDQPRLEPATPPVAAADDDGAVDDRAVDDRAVGRGGVDLGADDDGAAVPHAVAAQERPPGPSSVGVFPGKTS